MKKQLPRTLLYIVIIVLVFLAIQWYTSPKPQSILPEHGAADLTAMDLRQGLVEIAAQAWAYYPGQLYTPVDFQSGNTIAPTYGDNASTEEYGTYRLLLRLPPEKIYAITGRSPNLSQRLYIDGILAAEVGQPGKTRAETVPRTKTYDCYFMPQGETTELVFQIANFHHREGGRNTPVLIAEPAALSNYRILRTISSNIIVGCILTAALYFLGMYIFFSRQPHFLFLALSAFVTVLRMPIIGDKHIMEIFPELDWFVSIRLEYICLVLFIVFLLLYFDRLYAGMIPAKFTQAVVIFSALFILIVLFTDSLFFTRIQPYFAIVWVGASLITLYGLFRRLRKGDMHTMLIALGFLVFFLTALYDEIMYLFVDYVRLNNTMIVGVLVCVYMNMIALTLDFSEKERELAESRTAIMLSQIQPHFLYNVLVVIEQLCGINPRAAKETVGEFARFLRSNLDSIHIKQPIPFDKELAHVQTYLSLEKKRFGDRIQIAYDIECTSFFLPALSLQPLVENAVRYGVKQASGHVSVKVASREDEKRYVITIVDDGGGFDPQAIKQDGHAHLGIENVRGRLAAMCAGMVSIQNTIGVGTKVIIEIPKAGVNAPKG